MSIFNDFDENIFISVYQKYCSSAGGSSSNVIDTMLP